MVRLCERPGCSDRGAVAYGFDADRVLVWLTSFDPDVDRTRAGVLCKRHADSLVVPLGWTLDDLREPRPQLFKAPPAPRKRAPRRDPVTATRRKRAAEQPSLDAIEESTNSGSNDGSDQDKWMPVFDVTDDLDGLLRADSPLLARAFQGSTRRR
jgi:hypothetical protein